MSALDHVIATLRQEEDGFTIEGPDAWAQGRTLYGGITAALCHEAACRHAGDLPPLRSAQFAFVGPATGRLAFRPELLRQGRSATIVGVDCRSDAGLAARATFTFGAARESVVGHDPATVPALPAPEDCPPLHRTEKPLPGFLGRFEYRLATGAGLFHPGERPAFAVWTRFRDGEPADPVTALLALTDALPCAAMTVFPKPAPVSTMTWMVDLHQPLPAATAWRLVRSTSEQAADGYSLQEMTVHDRTGRTLASSRQVVAIFT